MCLMALVVKKMKKAEDEVVEAEKHSVINRFQEGAEEVRRWRRFQLHLICSGRQDVSSGKGKVCNISWKNKDVQMCVQE